jgi:hypothetical protein
MICSLDFSSLYGGLAVGAGFAFTAWAVWFGKYQPSALRVSTPVLASGLRGQSTLSRSTDAYVSLLQQARSRIERGHDATEILERAIGLVRARRVFVIAVTLILWTAAMLSAQQFLGGNAKCLRRMAEGEPVKTQQLANHAIPARIGGEAGRDTVALARQRDRALAIGRYSVGYHEELITPSLPSHVNRLELVHGPA